MAKNISKAEVGHSRTLTDIPTLPDTTDSDIAGIMYNSPSVVVVIPSDMDLDNIREHDIAGKEVISVKINQRDPQRRLRSAFVDYRNVDVNYVDQLMAGASTSLAHGTMLSDEGKSIAIVHGVITLPGSFILATDYSKAVGDIEINKPRCRIELIDQLEEAADKKIWEFEGYRLHRNLQTIKNLKHHYMSDIIHTGDKEVNIAMMLANTATVLDDPDSDNVFIAIEEERHAAIIASSGGQLWPVLAAIPRRYFCELQGILNSYIAYK